MNIEQIKEEYAKEAGYRETRLLEQDAFAGQHIDTLMQRAFNAALELAAEKAKVEKKLALQNGAVIGELHVVNKESILSLKINS